MMKNPSIVWFKHDLRLEDQPALNAAIAKGGPIIPLFVWAPEEEKEWAPGAASRWWLHGALIRLKKGLEKCGLTLLLRHTSSLEAILDIIQHTGADAVFWNRRYEPSVVERDALIKAELHRRRVESHIFNGSLLFNPWEILNKQNKPYQIFTHFWKACCQFGEIHPSLPKPQKAMVYKDFLHSEELDDLCLLPAIPWDKGLQEKWQPLTCSYADRFQNALDHIINHYGKTRDELAMAGTSELSPDLHFGEISPRMIWNKVRQKFGNQSEAAEVFLRQLGWREFANYVLFHFPRTPNESMSSRFDAFSWHTQPEMLQAWQKGKTGYPIVDAAMRQLWQIGWMHNRARMIVGSFLVKDLLIDWREGAKWFWDTLVDADLANNTLGWQWVAGCGVDAAPYFRIFNPILQGEKFDKKGEYIRSWVPELNGLPNEWIHRPWEAPENILKKAGVELGKTYPYPIVDHVQARKRALEAYAKIRG